MSKANKSNNFFDKAKDKVVKALDQNDDGKFNIADVSIVSDAVGKAAKESATKMKEAYDDYKVEVELNKLQPVFLKDLDSEEFMMPKFIRVADMDKQHSSSALCEGSIGHYTRHDENRFLTIYRNCLSDFGISLFEDEFCEFYFVDPCNRSKYLDSDSYFPYLKAARVSELQKIAQDLGAKHFRITYKEKKSYFSKVKAKANLKAGFGGKSATADGSHEQQEDSLNLAKIEAENTFPGCAPVEPEVKYLHRDPVIKNLIDMRLHETSPLGKQKITVEFLTTCGMKQQDACKIDAALKGLKATGNMSLQSEVQNESRRYFEYEVEF